MHTTFVTLTVLLFSHCACSQRTRLDSSFVEVAQRQAVHFYEQTLKQQAHVYEGNEYLGHDPRIRIHPYYLVDSLQTGTVIYKDVRYRDVKMLYDIVRDELAIQPPEGGYRHQIQMDKVAAFSLGPHQFARIVGDSVAGMRTGFYEIIYNGKVKALAKRKKEVQEDLSSGTYKGDYLIKDRYIIQKDGAFYEVKTKRSVLNLFPSQTKELRKYIRTNHLKFKREKREEAIAKITQRYDELTH